MPERTERRNTVAKEAKLAPADYRVDEIDTGVEGVGKITQAGVSVPGGKREAVEKAAEAQGYALIEINEGGNA